MPFKFASTIMTKKVLQFVYFSSCLLFKVNENKVTFASYRSERLSGNLLYLSEEMNRTYPDKKYVYLLRRLRGGIWGKLAYFTHLIKATYHLATSAKFIIDDFYIPVYFIKPRKGTEVIQLWHAAGIFKKFGLSTVGKPFGPSPEYLKHVRVHSNYSRLYVSSSEVIPYYSEAFGMDENRIFPLGLPRTDYFFRSYQGTLADRFYSHYPDLKGKKLILYAPTYRGRSHYQGAFKCPIDFNMLEEKLGNEYAVLIHLHPYMKVPDMSDHHFVYHFLNDYDIQELMYLADVLVTDYSSVIFDFSLLEKPMAFFAHDLDEYARERDFYLDYKNMVPGPVFDRTEALAEWIKRNEYSMDTIKRFQERFFDYRDGRASERIVQHILSEEISG
ncbi:CDP-glycerol glycerophosphotransferase family protein [Mesobacillus thioparans]|uniref:CDP-glycerol glycerophosphotransferase family protein n=1 Tax=Mesobacillus thioparans TaxID=370439 RepID=UPI0039EEDC02